MPSIRQDNILAGILMTLRGSLAACAEVAGSEVMTSTIIAGFLQTYEPAHLLTHLGGYGIAAVYEGHKYARELDTDVDPDGVPFKLVSYNLELGPKSG